MNNKLTFKQSFMAGLTAAAVAAVVNAVLYFVLHAAGIFTDTVFIQPNQPLSVIHILISSTFPTLIATLVFFLLEKYTKNGFKIFRIISIILLILSLGNPFMGIPNVPMGFAVALDVMHFVVVGALLYFIGNAVKKKSSAQ